MRLLAEMAGLKAVRMDNVMVITTEERAEKLRKEEKDLLPSPLDDMNNLRLQQAAGGGGVPGLNFVGPAFKAVPPPLARDGDPKDPPTPEPTVAPMLPPAVELAPVAPKKVAPLKD